MPACVATSSAYAASLASISDRTAAPKRRPFLDAISRRVVGSFAKVGFAAVTAIVAATPFAKERREIAGGC
jgi:hypothetical protein